MTLSGTRRADGRERAAGGGPSRLAARPAGGGRRRRGGAAAAGSYLCARPTRSHPRVCLVRAASVAAFVLWPQGGRGHRTKSPTVGDAEAAWWTRLGSRDTKLAHGTGFGSHRRPPSLSCGLRDRKQPKSRKLPSPLSDRGRDPAGSGPHITNTRQGQRPAARHVRSQPARSLSGAASESQVGLQESSYDGTEVASSCGLSIPRR